MEMKAIFVDAAILVAALLAVLIGAKRGLLRSLVSVAMLVLSFWFAIWCADHLTEPMMKLLEHRIETRAQERLSEKVPVDVEALPGILGDIAQGLSDAALSVIEDNLREAMEPVVHTAIFVIVLILARLLLGLIGKAVDLAGRLPVIRTCNTLGGAALGLVSGVLILFVALQAVQRFGWIDAAVIEESRLGSLFTPEQAQEMIGSL